MGAFFLIKTIFTHFSLKITMENINPLSPKLHRCLGQAFLLLRLILFEQLKKHLGTL